MGHHSTSDDSLAYRAKEEIATWTAANNNPLERIQAHLKQLGVWTEEWEAQQRQEKRAAVLAALTAAEAKPKPPIDELFTDVYAQMPPHLLEQREELLRLVAEYPECYPGLKQHRQ